MCIRDSSKLLRQTLSRSVEFIPLGEELDTLKCYVELQHLRYPDTFDYSCEVDEALRDNTCLLYTSRCV